MERGTGIEPATNSVEGCDSTVELPPPSLVVNNTKFTTACQVSGTCRKYIPRNPRLVFTCSLARENPNYHRGQVYLLQLSSARVVTSLDRCPSLLWAGLKSEFEATIEPPPR
jgi:hypothetical protein